MTAYLRSDHVANFYHYLDLVGEAESPVGRGFVSQRANHGSETVWVCRSEQEAGAQCQVMVSRPDGNGRWGTLYLHRNDKVTVKQTCADGEKLLGCRISTGETIGLRSELAGYEWLLSED